MPLGTKVGLGPGHIVLHGDPRSSPKRGTTASNFRPTSIVAKRSPISANAEQLLMHCERKKTLPVANITGMCMMSLTIEPNPSQKMLNRKVVGLRMRPGRDPVQFNPKRNLVDKPVVVC